MEPTQREPVLPPQPTETNGHYDNGDTFDEDTGSSLGRLELDVQEEGKLPPSFPVELSVYLDGFFYIYKLDRKYKEGEEE